ncbi:hypothetical protein [Sneathiella sp.]|uniref:hypothetical protein n=1 Tax=Sneathiella sp. TaxID=1964365 RepID=UPI002625692D|nr:hypothetical protein [Sneathiella sp.]MDF2368873.1 hypothetical protein [Sneathiella sp.]
MNTKNAIPFALSILILAVLPFSAVIADEKSYDPGSLNVKCSCNILGKEKIVWHHIIRVPKTNFLIDLNEVCRTTFDNYEVPDTICNKEDDFVGSEYAFDQD